MVALFILGEEVDDVRGKALGKDTIVRWTRFFGICALLVAMISLSARSFADSTHEGTPHASRAASPQALVMERPLGLLGDGVFIQLAIVVEINGARGVAYDCTGEREACHGIGANADLGDGTMVTIADSTGMVVAFLPLFLHADPTDNGLVLIAYPLVPGGDEFSIQIADRAPVSMTTSQLEQSEWIYRLEATEP